MKKYFTAGVITSLKNTWMELRTCYAHKKGTRVARKLAGQQHLKLHVGCGGKLKEGWVNIDIVPGVDITIDAREPLPFPDGSCGIIYSEHFLEHLDYPGETLSFLRECYRVLEPGGVFNVGVPDTEWPIMEYTGQSGKGYFELAKKLWHPRWCETEMEHINYHFRQDGMHRFAYDFKTLVKILTTAGFEKIMKREFDPRLDSQERKLGTLFMTAIKPNVET